MKDEHDNLRKRTAGIVYKPRTRIETMPVWNVTSYLSWLIYAVVVGMITMFVIGASSFLFYRSEISLLSQKVKNALKRR